MRKLVRMNMWIRSRMCELRKQNRTEDQAPLLKEIENIKSVKQLLFANHEEAKVRKEYLEGVRSSVQANSTVEKVFAAFHINYRP